MKTDVQILAGGGSVLINIINIAAGYASPVHWVM